MGRPLCMRGAQSNGRAYPTSEGVISLVCESTLYVAGYRVGAHYGATLRGVSAFCSHPTIYRTLTCAVSDLLFYWWLLCSHQSTSPACERAPWLGIGWARTMASHSGVGG